MFQAIVTKYLGPTNTRGARIKVTADAGSITLDWDHALNSRQNYVKAAKQFMKQFKWDEHYTLESGYLPKSNDGYMVHVMVPKYKAALADEVLSWAKEPRDHGGNPYCYKFVKTAQDIIEGRAQ
jgi:hypothetical protein